MSPMPTWIGQAATPTEGEVGRLCSPVARDVLDACAAATTPTSAEIDLVRASPDPAVLRDCADATAPSGAEVARLLLRLRARPSGTSWLAIPRPVFAAVVAALIAAGGLLLLRGPGWPDPGTGIRLADGEHLRLGPSIELEGPAGLAFGVRGQVELLDGRVAAEVDPNGRQRVLSIRAGELLATVVGTRFEIAVSDGRAVVRVERGMIRVQAPSVDRLLVAGEGMSWPEAATVVSRTTAVQPEPPPSDASQAAFADSAPGGRAARAQDPPAVPVHERSLPSKGEALALRERVAPPPRPGPERPEILDPSRPEIAPAAPGEPACATEPDDVRHFRRLLEAIEMNRSPAITLHLAEEFLSRHTDSMLAEEARIIRLELLAQVAPAAEAVAELDGWLAQHPDHPAFLDLLERRADVARNGLRSCRQALPGYRVLAARAAGERRARARAFRGLCAFSEGLNDEARTSLTEALEDPFLAEDLRFEVGETLASLESSGVLLRLRRAR